ncbi:MAG: hypothetical protein HRJ53_17875 [Acidobacteria bacterium Pan2503]|uniref:Uncharacterized protein n=1 Tax=Candidatus Acidiferrum panamense TaxID=2741543 RepID=A0A7V8NSR8_9BACT|nr:hypothetical protein [Candidatus Acidoferrum panamensis]
MTNAVQVNCVVGLGAGNPLATGCSTSNGIYNNPTSMTLTNNQYNADGSLNQSRLTPRTAGFGAANGALPMRNIQLELRLEF